MKLLIQAASSERRVLYLLPHCLLTKVILKSVLSTTLVFQTYKVQLDQGRVLKTTEIDKIRLIF